MTEPSVAPPALPDDPLDWRRPGLSGRSRRIALAAAEAMLADEDATGAVVAGPVAASERAVAGFDGMLGAASLELRRSFAALALALEWLPLFVVGAPSRMSRLPLAARVRYLRALEESRVTLLSLLLVAFKIPLCLRAFEEGPELASTGFDRPDTVIRRSELRAAPARAEVAS